MNIALSTSVIQRGLSGVAQYVLSLVRAFLPYAKRHQFTLFVLEEDMPLFDFVGQTMNRVAVPERYRPAVRNILWHQTILPRLIRKHQIDVLHVPSYRRMLCRRPCALVTTIHDLAPFRLAKKYDWKRMFYGRVVARQMARRQDKIVTVSEDARKDVLRFFKVPSERLTMVHNGVDHSRFFQGSREEAREYVARHHGLCDPFFLYIARLEHPAKNHVRLIRAFDDFKAETHSDWKLVLGGSDWRGANVIHSSVEQSPFRGDIRRLGFVNEADLPMWYRAADVFVYPSLFEGFGLPPVEAMACGCPVLSSTCGSLGEVIGGAAATVDPLDVRALKQQMIHLMANADLRACLREAGLKRAQHFSWERTAMAMLNAYSQALAGRRGEKSDFKEPVPVMVHG